jgi:hypothetical protein
MSITDSHLEKLKDLAQNAGKAILEIYNSSDFGIEQKATILR